MSWQQIKKLNEQRGDAMREMRSILDTAEKADVELTPSNRRSSMS